MQPPDELMVDAFLPGVRQLVARRLRGEGLSQGRIASVLGVTQASVSLYLSSDAARAYSLLARFSVTRDEADRYAAVLAEDARRSPHYAVETLSGIWSSVLGSGRACEAHRREYPGLAGCDVCLKGSERRGDARSETLAQVARAVREIESSSAFVRAMPEVSVNLACASGDSSSEGDIVAIPGRIVRVRNLARAMGQPEFGASRHVSRVLLLVRTRRSDIRAAINLRYDQKMAGVLARLGLRVLRIRNGDDLGSGDPTVGALKRKLASSGSPFDAVVDEGGRGIEPNVYLFGRDAPEVARLAIKASEAYSAG